MIALICLAVALTALIASPRLRGELYALWRTGRAALVALLSAALAAGYLLRGPSATDAPPPAQIPCPPCAPTAAPRPYEVDHASVELLDPLPAPAPDMGSGLRVDDLDARVRALDERARARRR